MEQKEFMKLISITSTETITDNSYLSLRIDEIDTPVGIWGWSEKLENIRDHFLYVFILGCMVMYNEKRGINKVSNEFLMSVYNDEIMDAYEVSDEEEKFFMLWNNLTECTNYKEFKKGSTKLCDYLTSLGYSLQFKLYKNPKEAVEGGGVIGTYVPTEHDEFLSFLKENIESN